MTQLAAGKKSTTKKNEAPLDRSAEKDPSAGVVRPVTIARSISRNPQKDLSGARIDVSSFFLIYRTQSDVADCVRELRQSTGAGGYRWVNPVDETIDPPTQLTSQLDAILNYDFPFSRLRRHIVRDWQLTGNGYAALIMNLERTRVLGLQVMDPRTVAIVSDSHGQVFRYIQKTTNDVVVFDPVEVLHFTDDPDPSNEVFGMSPLEPILWEVRTDLAAAISNYKFFENDATPSTHFILDESLSEVESQAAVDSLKQHFSGADNKHKPFVAKGIKEIKTISISQKDMDFLGGRRFNTEKICARFGVPKFVLGYTDTVNNNNGTELQKKFYKGTIEPIEADFAAVINHQLIPRLGLEGKVKFEFLPQGFDEEQSVESRAQAEYDRGLCTLRQYRQKTNQQITPEDEEAPHIDKHLILNGASAVFVEDVGIDPIVDPNNTATATNTIRAIEKLAGKVKADADTARSAALITQNAKSDA